MVAVFIVFIMIVKLVPVFEACTRAPTPCSRLPTRTASSAPATRFRDYTALVFLLVIVTAVLVPWDSDPSGADACSTAPSCGSPLFGGLVRKRSWRDLPALSVLVSAGIPLLEAMETVARVSGNKVIEAALIQADRQMQDGGTIAATLRQDGPVSVDGHPARRHPARRAARLPPCWPGPPGTTSSSGQLGRYLSTLIEPIMIIIMGAIAGGVIFALYLRSSPRPRPSKAG